MINLIACVTIYKNQLAIGRNLNLLFKLEDDLLFFKNITTNSLNKKSKLNHNIVLMGRKTFDSIKKPLSNRINLVLTKQSNIIFSPRKLIVGKVYYINIKISISSEL